MKKQGDFTCAVAPSTSLPLDACRSKVKICVITVLATATLLQSHSVFGLPEELEKRWRDANLSPEERGELQEEFAEIVKTVSETQRTLLATKRQLNEEILLQTFARWSTRISGSLKGDEDLANLKFALLRAVRVRSSDDMDGDVAEMASEIISVLDDAGQLYDQILSETEEFMNIDGVNDHPQIAAAISDHPFLADVGRSTSLKEAAEIRGQVRDAEMALESIAVQSISSISIEEDTSRGLGCVAAILLMTLTGVALVFRRGF